MESNYIDKDRYERAAKRVKRIRGFYSHAIVYVVINMMIVVVNIQNLDAGESYFQWHNFTTLFFWGIGLVAHGVSVFVPNYMLGKDWEERKIKELMEKDKKPWK
ncbi:2TM domain-containing protein [Mariniflexile sp. AS56]|uniref:2TM domain-containing protein n=1 Tax=Mariniflexile sp. AS56 TaxID=3063957 RepID=UPI0026F313C5|nr:2TM domain-containing protein [Mariniflexile sp. AS56]MDO7173951.1 2TM domain-containing protein [Mariniflexile sp. AS56]